MTIKISQLGNLTAFDANTYIPVVGNVSGTLTTLKSNTATLKTYIIGTLDTDVANLVANAGTQDSSITSLQTNVTTLQGNVSTLTANAATQSGVLATLTSNVATQSGAIADLEGNVTVLQDELANTVSNVTTLQGSVSDMLDGTATFGNLVPGANVAYSLGSPDAQWKDLYLSGSTIYIGGAEIAVANAAITTSLPFTATGTISADDMAVTGSVIAGTIYAGQAELTGYTTLYQTGFDGNIDNGTAGTVALSVTTDGDTWADQGALVVESNNINGDAILPSNDSQYSLGNSNFKWNVYAANVSIAGNLTAPVITNLDNRVVSLETGGANITANITTLQGNVAFTMANYQHWTSNVTSINDALNQIAERIWNIENP